MKKLLTLLLVLTMLFAACGSTTQSTATPAPTEAAPAETPAPVETEAPAPAEPARGILLSTTIGPVDAGVIDALIDAYTAQNPNITVRYLARGTGAAISLAEGGDVDMVIVHAKSLEEKFVADGFGTERIDFMYNDYVLVGPKDDPAGIAGSADISEALKKISDTGSKFISRGDNSGTHVKEVEIWTASGMTPEGDWYEVYEKGNTGNKATILYTDEQNAYTIIDRATFITNKDSLKNIQVLHENDEIMLNYITIIPCSPEKFNDINAEDAAAFIEWLTGAEAQEIVKNFGVDVYGEPLFFPNAK